MDISLSRLLTSAIIILFLFSGDPDVFDLLRDKAIYILQPKQTNNKC